MRRLLGCICLNEVFNHLEYNELLEIPFAFFVKLQFCLCRSQYSIGYAPILTCSYFWCWVNDTPLDLIFRVANKFRVSLNVGLACSTSSGTYTGSAASRPSCMLLCFVPAKMCAPILRISAWQHRGRSVFLHEPQGRVFFAHTWIQRRRMENSRYIEHVYVHVTIALLHSPA